MNRTNQILRPPAGFRLFVAVAAMTVVGIATAAPVFSAHSVATTAPADAERDAFLRAIAEVETGGNPRAVGRLGERGMFQFRSVTWRQHTTQPFTDAHNPRAAYAVAAKHYDWIKWRLRENGRRPTPYLIAAAWNSGVTRVVSGRIPASSRDYAQRVVNLASVWSPSIRAAAVTESAPLLALAD